jgi:hypothetical protein
MSDLTLNFLVWVVVSENGEKYTEYVKTLAGSRVTMLSLFSGFTFSTITILLNQLPDPSSLISQLTLFFLVVLFDLCLFLLAWQTLIVLGTYNVRNAPARAKWELTVFNLLLTVVFILWGWSVVLMFLLRNLYYLALVSGVLWVAVIVAGAAVTRGRHKRLGWSIKEELKNIRGKQ